MSWREIWHSMKPSARLGLVIGTGMLTVFAAVAAYWVLSTRYEVLFTGLDPQDAARVVAELERLKQPYKLEEGGTRILVSDDAVHEVRLKLLGSGAPIAGGVGFEIFDNQDFGMTEFAQKINYQRALQGELTRTITALREVKHARVHLVLPDGGLFKQDTGRPSASVTLFLKNGAQLSPQQILGIQRLVAASVSGLDASAVTVIDQQGIVLSRSPSEPEGMDMISARLQKKREMEEYLTKKALQVLDKTFGPWQAVVSIDVVLNLDHKKTTLEDVAPQGKSSDGVVRRREARESAQEGKNSNVTMEVEYQLGHRVEQIEQTPGTIQRLSIGVLVPAGTDASRLVQIQELIAAAIGLNLERGDVIAIHPVDMFQTADSDALGLTAESPGTRGQTVPPTAIELQGAVAKDPADLSSDKGQSDVWTAWRLLVEQKDAVATALVLLIALFAMTGLLIANRRRRGRTERALSVIEREQVLLRLQSWLDSSAEETSLP